MVKVRQYELWCFQQVQIGASLEVLANCRIDPIVGYRIAKPHEPQLCLAHRFLRLVKIIKMKKVKM